MCIQWILNPPNFTLCLIFGKVAFVLEFIGFNSLWNNPDLKPDVLNKIQNSQIIKNLLPIIFCNWKKHYLW